MSQRGRAYILERIREEDHGYGSPCWAWQLHRDYQGYGRATIDMVPMRAHRLSYESFIGPIPEGLQVDHLCRVRCCVNPAHLEPVTRRENILRGEGWTAQHARKTHCTHGHEFTPENTKLRPPNNQRICLTCARNFARTAQERRRAKDAA